MATKKKKFVPREDDDLEDHTERDEDEEIDDDEDEDGVEVPSLLDVPLKDPVDRQVYMNCYAALITAAKMKGSKIDFDKLADEAEDAFYAAVERFGGRGK